MANVITTLLRMDSTQFKTGMRQAQQSIQQTDGVINKAKAGWASAFAGFASSPVAIGAATAAVGVFAQQSISAASDLEESVNAVNVTFGEAADKILEFGDNAAKSVGLAQSEFNQLATPLGSILKNAGFGLDEVADKTIVLTQRAADMASVFNTDVSEALGAIQAGLRGEQDPLERFGVGLSAARVEARALADTGKDTAKQLTEQEKQLARVNIILDQTNQTAGDFANTSDSLANQTKILKAEFKDLQATAGQQLIPILSDLAGVLIDVRDGAVTAKDAIEDIPGGKGLLDALGTNIFELPRKSKQEWDELGRKIGVVPDKVEEIGSKRAIFEQMIADGNAAKDAIAATGDAAGETADEVADLGDKAANSGPKIGDMAGALADARERADEAADAIKNDLAEAIRNDLATAIDEINGKFDDFRSELDLSGLLDDIQEDFENVAEAQKELGEGGEEAARDYREEIRKLQLDVLRLIENYGDIPAEKLTTVLVKLRTGDVDDINAVLDEVLGKERFIKVGLIMPNVQQAFSGVNVTVAPNAIPSTNILGLNPAPASIDNSQTTIIYPVGTTPTSVTVDRRTYDARNQFDRTRIR